MEILKRIILFFWILITNLNESNAAGNWIDLTHDLAQGIPMYPAKGSQPFKIYKHVVVTEPIWNSLNDFVTSEHMGTHLDAPRHFNPNNWFVNEIPVERFVAPAVIVNFSDRAAKETDAALLKEDLLAWEETNGRIPDGSVVFAFSGWDKYWNDTTKYLGKTEKDPTVLHSPAFGAGALEWLVKQRNIVGIGVDSVSVDVGNSTTFPVHRLMTDNNLYGLENVANLGLLPPIGATVYSFPLKIEGGTGSPLRIIAQIPN